MSVASTTRKCLIFFFFQAEDGIRDIGVTGVQTCALPIWQQQMLTVAQGLVRRPGLLMLDEPSAGLSSRLVDRVLNVIGQLREQGTAVLLVEQLLEKALASADRVYALVQGRIALQAPTSEPNLPHRLERAYFGHDGHPLGTRPPPSCA